MGPTTGQLAKAIGLSSAVQRFVGVAPLLLLPASLLGHLFSRSIS